MKQKVKMNLIQQDVFVRAVTEGVDLKKDFLIDSYVSCDEVVKENGTEYVSTLQEYPITPDSVNSYADGTNYRNDLSAFGNRPAPGRNLGDVSAIQEILAQSPEKISELFGRFSNLKASQKKTETDSSANEVKNG